MFEASGLPRRMLSVIDVLKSVIFYKLTHNFEMRRHLRNDCDIIPQWLYVETAQIMAVDHYLAFAWVVDSINKIDNGAFPRSALPNNCQGSTRRYLKTQVFDGPACFVSVWEKNLVELYLTALEDDTFSRLVVCLWFLPQQFAQLLRTD